MHVTVSFQVVVFAFQPTMAVDALTTVERLMRESLAPGVSVTPFLFR